MAFFTNFFFFQAEDGIRDHCVTGVQTCALPISARRADAVKTLPTTLPGVMLLELEVFGDARGRFMETYRRERYAEVGIGVELVQDSLSSSVRGVLRGLHYQLANPQAKLVHVSRGEVFDVCVDIR